MARDPRFPEDPGMRPEGDGRRRRRGRSPDGEDPTSGIRGNPIEDGWGYSSSNYRGSDAWMSADYGNAWDYGRERAFPGELRDDRGEHLGEDPNGYRGSDDRLRAIALERLDAHPELDASEIEVDVRDAVVTLMGSVEDGRARRTAERLCDGISGVSVVLNHLQVSEWGEGEPTGPDN